MKCYNTPELRVINYDVENRVMDGYAPGDIVKNPWASLFAADESGNQENAGVLTLE